MDQTTETFLEEHSTLIFLKKNHKSKEEKTEFQHNQCHWANSVKTMVIVLVLDHEKLASFLPKCI